MKTFSDIARKNNDHSHKVNAVFNCKIMNWGWVVQLLYLSDEHFSVAAEIFPWDDLMRKAVCEESLNADGSVLCLPAHQAEDETWQCFPAVLFWSLGWWVCIPSARPGKEVSLCTCLIIFLTRNVWKKLPYVILGWPEGRMLISDSRWFSVCPESILLLN